MGQIISIMGKAANPATVAGGTGNYGNPFNFGLPDGIFLVTNGYAIPSTQDVTKAFLISKVKDGTIIPLLDAYNFEPINEDDVLETSNTGVNSLARKGLTSLKFTFKKGVEFEKAMEALLSYGNFDVWIIDKAGNFLGVDIQGAFGGFTGGLVLPKAKMWNDGSVSEGKSIEIQLTQPGEFKQMTWIEADRLDFFAPTEIDGVNNAKLSFATASASVPPANTDTTVSIGVFANDGVTPVTGLALGDFRSTTHAVSAVSETGAGYYVLTVAAITTADEVIVEIYDVAGTVAVVNVADILFSGSVSATAIA